MDKALHQKKNAIYFKILGLGLKCRDVTVFI